jgi:hypothetical protein
MWCVKCAPTRSRVCPQATAPAAVRVAAAVERVAESSGGVSSGIIEID